MAEFFKKLGSFLGVEDIDDYDKDYLDETSDMDEDFSFQEEETLKVSNRGKRRDSGNIVTLPNANSMKMIVYHPMNYEDTQHIIDNLKSRKPVVVNMEHLLPEAALRILDFMSGAIYALNGTMYKVSQGIFIVAPTNYDIVGDGDDYSDGAR